MRMRQDVIPLCRKAERKSESTVMLVIQPYERLLKGAPYGRVAWSTKRQPMQREQTLELRSVLCPLVIRPRKKQNESLFCDPVAVSVPLLETQLTQHNENKKTPSDYAWSKTVSVWKNDPRFATRGIRNRTGLLTPDCDGTLRSLGHRVVNTKESENLVRAEKI